MEPNKLLLVDDNKVNLTMTAMMLSETRYGITTATSGAEALRILEREKPDLVLLDLHMPEMDGLETLQRIRAIKGMERLPVVFLTADQNPDTEAALFNAGAMDFITKPMVKQVAMQRIRRILELKRLQDSLHEEVDRKTLAFRESNQRIINLSEQIIRALAGAIDAKDAYTNGHSTRVAAYSRELARRLGKPAAEAEKIYNIALLHDIGKIGISESIINKPSKLTDEEYAIIKSHAMKGYEILKNISELPELSIGARWHHERYDGKGYPDGKEGENIPEIARIICVADCYDAMTSDRVYRPALPQQVVRDEIQSNAGTQFDPKIAGIMLQMIDEDKEYKMKGSRA